MGKAKRKKQRNRAKKHARRMASSGGRSVFMGMSKQTIQTAPVRDTFISTSIFNQGMGPVVISRNLPDGSIAMGVFLVDVFCLGVKNAFFTMCSELKYQDAIGRIGSHQGLESVEPSYARKLVEDAVEYARGLGFEPQRDYRDAEVVLGDIEAEACREEFTFGKDGKPLYVSGPDDSEQVIHHILSTLRSRCGDDGFHYIIGMGDIPHTDFETD